MPYYYPSLLGILRGEGVAKVTTPKRRQNHYTDPILNQPSMQPQPQPTLFHQAQPRFVPCTTDSDHDQPIAPNRLAQRPPPAGPNQIWLQDITYVPTAQG